ncbi:subtilisin-like serine protease, partial [Ceratobasidium sp. 395]
FIEDGTDETCTTNRKLKDNVSKDAHLSSVISGFIAGSSLQYKYGDIFHGYAINLHGQDLALLRRSKDIEYVIEDGIATIDYLPEDNLDVSRKSQAVFESLSAQVTGGEGVDVYGIDTGIYTNHSCFGGRASWGATYGGYADADGNGHGTHTAGTAVGEKYGQAPRAKIIAVKVLSDYGFGAWSDIISGVAFAVAGMQASGRPSISTMSIGGSQFTPVDTAIRNGIAQGMHYTVAAGNSNVDAATTSPAGVAEAVTVGAVDYNNTKAWFSNYGPIVDVQAPGVDVLSAWIGSPNATNIISGTSMAT